jgi:hypothetical protein
MEPRGQGCSSDFLTKHHAWLITAILRRGMEHARMHYDYVTLRTPQLDRFHRYASDRCTIFHESRNFVSAALLGPQRAKPGMSSG